MANAIDHMLTLEIAASAWFERMSAKEQEAYLRAHPGSRLGHARKRVEAILQRYLRSDGHERDTAARKLHDMGVSLPEEPLPPPRYHKFQTETVHVRPRRAGTPKPEKTKFSDRDFGKRGNAKRTREIHDGTDVRQTSEDLRAHGVYGAEDVGTSLHHGIAERNVEPLMRLLKKQGWSHKEVVPRNGVGMLHGFNHPNGGLIVVHHTPGRSTMSGKDRYVVHVMKR